MLLQRVGEAKSWKHLKQLKLILYVAICVLPCQVGLEKEHVSSKLTNIKSALWSLTSIILTPPILQALIVFFDVSQPSYKAGETFWIKQKKLIHLLRLYVHAISAWIENWTKSSKKSSFNFETTLLLTLALKKESNRASLSFKKTTTSNSNANWLEPPGNSTHVPLILVVLGEV